MRGSYSSFITVDWIDHARDLLNFAENYIPSGPFDASPLPVHLSRVPDEISASRVSSGLTDRRFVAIGHSISGCSMWVSIEESRPKGF